MQSIVIGKISKPRGIKGEIRVLPLTDNPDRFNLLTEIEVETERETSTLFDVEKCSFTSKEVILKLKGIDTRNQAEELKGCYITIREKQTISLEEGNYFVYEIIGLKAFDENGTPLGEVIEVRSNPGNDIYVLKKGDKEHLIPAVKEFITDIDLENKTMTIKVIEGLFE